MQTHQHYFGETDSPARSRNPFVAPADIACIARETLAPLDAKAGLQELKRQLARLGASIPTLYRHYVDLCENDGVRFLAFGTDPSFGHCVDGLIRLDLHRLKPAKRERYIGGNNS